jgi:hypothetical protein
MISSAVGSKTRTGAKTIRPAPVEARATRVVIAIFGILAGLAGIEHGIGEISQGSIRPAALIIESWPDATAFAILGGEPALTVLPNLLLGGVLTVIIAAAFGIWSVAFVQRRGSGLVLILLSLVLLLVGGGFAPPLIGLILGVAALRMHSVPRRKPRRAVGVAGYLALVPGTVLLYYFAGVANDTLVYALISISFAALILSLVAARVADQLALDRVIEDHSPSHHQ